MAYIRCTQNILKRLKLSPPLLEEPQDSILGDWYANVIRLSRKQCVIFVNEKTLFSFIAVQVSLKPQILQDAFVTGLNYRLVEEGILPQTVLKICLEYQHLAYSKTKSRSIIGSMNDLSFLYCSFIESLGGISECDLSSVVMRINRTPQKNLDWRYAITAVEALLSGAST